MPISKRSPSHDSRNYALAILLGVNLLNYIDRQALYAVFPLIKADLHVSDAALGLLGSAFMICYMVSAPLLGWLGDRLSRARLAAAGLLVWSLSTVLSGLAPNYGMLLAARTAVGIGEASFGTVSPGLIADYFSKDRRGRVLAWFYLAVPVGSAIGYLSGGSVGHFFGWHAAFLMVGLPGLVMALPVWRLREPRRGGAENPDSSSDERNYRELFGNYSFICDTLATAAMTFALGGLAQWIPTFLHRAHGLNVAQGNLLFGAVTVVAGIGGTLGGGWLGDRLQKRSAAGYLVVSGWGLAIGAPLTAWAIVTPSLQVCLILTLFAEFFLFLNTGPLNTVLVNVTRPTVRAMAFAVNIFFIHALGDAISPTFLGWLSDRWGLQKALLVTPAAVAAAAGFCFLCRKFVAADSARAEA
ncbi:spinster family MFS transporter [Methylocaldum sp. MU1018]